MDIAIRLATAALVIGLAACAAPAPRTVAMGGPASCDLHVDVRADRHCAVQHVSPADSQSQLTNSMRTLETQTVPH